MTAQPITCERCGDELVRSYSTTTYSGLAQTFQIAPDGTGAVFPIGGVVACSWNCLAILAAQRAGRAGDAAVQIVAERERQITQEGWSPEHDAGHPAGALASAGAFYVLHAVEGRGPDSPPVQIRTTPPDVELGAVVHEHRWPWEPEWWKPKSRERDLIRAGALIAAELDRDPSRRRYDPTSEPF